MAKKFLTNLDLAKNQLLNAAIQNLASAPSNPVSGQIYFNTSDGLIYYFDGTTWNDITGDVRDVLGGLGLTANTSNGVVTLDVNVDNSTLEITGDSIQVKDSGITTSKIADLSTNIDYNFSPSAIPTAYAVKRYVDAVAGGLGNLEGGWDVLSFGTFPVSATIKKGDYWYATSSGTIYTDAGQVVVEVGDVFVAKIDNANQGLESDWLVLQVNKDQATESILGLVRIAAGDDVSVGIDDTKAITPLKLKQYLDNRTGGYAQTFGEPTKSYYNFAHNLNATDILVSVYEIGALGNVEVFADVTIIDANSIAVEFASNPTGYNEYRVVIKK